MKRASEVLVTRVEGSRWVLLGLKDCGHVRLSAVEAVQLAEALLRTAGDTVDDVDADRSPETNDQ